MFCYSFLQYGIARLLLGNGLHDDFPTKASMILFLASNGESHAFLFLWSLNHVVG